MSPEDAARAPSAPLTARLVSWDRARGYGYLEHEGRRVFLHVRDFAERHKAPEIGDEILFTFGTDAQGRPCAKNARHHNDGGRLRLAHFAIAGLLLLPPAVAGWHLAHRHAVWYLLGGYAAASGLTYFLYADDKHRARSGGWRAPEKALHFFELAGGWPGAFLAQRRLRHKCSKLSYQFVFWLIVAAHQFVAIDFLLDWRMSRELSDGLRALLSQLG